MVEGGIVPKAITFSGAQTNGSVIAAPGAGFAIRIYYIDVISATGAADVHEETSGTKLCVAIPGAVGKFEPRKVGSYYQIPTNKALQVTSAGDVSVNVTYEIVRTKNTAD